MNEPGPGQLLFAFVRRWSRYASAGHGDIAENGRLVVVTEAVAGLVGRGQAATVNAVAAELGLDQSGASRLIRSAVDADFLTMTMAPQDARRREATVTAAGHTALRQARAWQERTFAELTAGWSQRRREDFRSAMADLIARLRPG